MVTTRTYLPVASASGAASIWSFFITGIRSASVVFCVSGVVVDTENKFKGIVSTFDYVTKAVANDLPMTSSITKIMSTSTPFSLNTKVVDCFNVMKKDQMEVVPVADATGKLVGVVTIMDVFNAIEYFSGK